MASSMVELINSCGANIMRTISPTTRAPRTAFVLSGGASLGAMQVGMLRALYERGITSDLLVGTSAGALNAAFVASRPQTVATAEELAGVWRAVHRDDVFPIDARTLTGGLSNHRDHLVSDRGLRRLARRAHLRPGDRRPARARHPRAATRGARRRPARLHRARRRAPGGRPGPLLDRGPADRAAGRQPPPRPAHRLRPRQPSHRRGA